MAKRSELPVEQREAAVLAVLRREEPAAVVARRYGVSEQTLSNWRNAFLEGGRQGLSGKREAAKDRWIEELETMISERERVIGELTIANRILKKTGLRPA